MNSLKALLVILLLSAVSGSSFYAGRKMAPRPMVMDPASGAWAPLVTKDGVKIFVASPDGFAPGILAGHSKDGSEILILPPDLIGAAHQSDQPQPAQSADDPALKKS